MRIGVYAIALNEVGHVARFLRACAGAELVMVADTGSTDGTVAALRAGGAIVHHIGISPWRFDDARNAALALLPRDIDICVSLDLDEVLSEGWRTAIGSEWRQGTTRGRYLYAWSHRPDRSPAVEFWADKIHARSGYRWRHPCHEVLYPDRLQERHVTLRGLRVDHWPDDSKSRAQYLPLLQVAVTEDPTDARNAHYLGRELLALGRHAEAEAELHRCLSLPGATWVAQNSSTMRMLAKCRRAQGDAPGETEWLRRSVAATPELRDPWVHLADCLYRRQDWAGCHEAATRALGLDHKPDASVNDPRSTGSHPHDLASIAAWKLGLREESLRHAEAALALSPEDERMRQNVETIRRILLQPAREPAADGAVDS